MISIFNSNFESRNNKKNQLPKIYVHLNLTIQSFTMQCSCKNKVHKRFRFSLK